MPGTIELPTPEIDAEIESKKVRERDYTVIVWDDPVNLMPYVTHVFQQVFGWGREKHSGTCSKFMRKAAVLWFETASKKRSTMCMRSRSIPSPPRWNRPHETSRVRRGGHFWFLTPRERNLLLTLFLVLSTHANELG